MHLQISQKNLERSGTVAEKLICRQGQSLPLGCVTLWNRTMSSGDKRFSATKFTSEPVRRLALKMASFMTSVQYTLSYTGGMYEGDGAG